MIAEQVSSDTFERAVVSDTTFPAGAVPVGPSRNGYVVDVKMRQSLFDDGESTFTLLTETLKPSVSNEPAVVGWYWAVADWQSMVYQPGSNPSRCDADGCISLYTDSVYGCGEIRDAMKSRTKAQCMQSGDGLMVVLLGAASGVFLGVATFAILTGPSLGAGAPVGAASGVAVAGAVGGAAWAYADMMCENQAVQAAFELQVQNGCVNTDAPDDPDEPGDGIEPATGADGETDGCLACVEETTVETEHFVWDEEKGEGTVTLERETGCVRFAFDPDGEDADGDGYCDAEPQVLG